MRRGRVLVGLWWVGVAALLVVVMWQRAMPVRAAEVARSPALLEDPDAACAGCHAGIAASYARTSMARGSGVATAALVPGSFHDRPSGVDYRVFLRDGAAWMSYARAGKPELGGERRLELFVGSGKKGRTYLYQVGDAWFELPINFYTRVNGWEMAPNMEGGARMPAALPVDANCLHCHASEVQRPMAEARNRFATVPFRQAGIGCSACHGDGAAHVLSGGKAAIVNPDKLAAARRDSVCLQCHLEGDAVVYRAGRSLAQFRAGDDLREDAVYFVKAAGAEMGLRATSQYEALLRSACLRAVGERMTCTTCHDPHSSPEPAERVQFFRAKCVQCHSSPAIAVRHHPEQQSCAACHMPTRVTTDISHEQTVDHDIEARPVTAAGGGGLRLVAMAARETLVPVGAVESGDRELGLAYAQRAHAGEKEAAARALPLLRAAEARGQNDAEVELELGYLEQLRGESERARAQYAAALREEPMNGTALGNLGVLEVQAGDLRGGVELLQRLVAADPSQTTAGLDLAFLACSLGKPAEAKRLAEQLQRVNPDDAGLGEFVRTGRYGGRVCAAAGPPDAGGTRRPQR